MDVPNFSNKALAIGLNLAPRAFTKLMTFPRKLLEIPGLSSIFYLDGILIWSNSQKLALQHMNLALDILTRLGILINEIKSVLVTSQNL